MNSVTLQGRSVNQQGRKDSNPVREFWRLAALPGAHPSRATGGGCRPIASRNDKWTLEPPKRFARLRHAVDRRDRSSSSRRPARPGTGAPGRTRSGGGTPSGSRDGIIPMPEPTRCHGRSGAGPDGRSGARAGRPVPVWKTKGEVKGWNGSSGQISSYRRSDCDVFRRPSCRSRAQAAGDGYLLTVSCGLVLDRQP